VRWEIEWSCDGKLCLYISTKNYENLITGFQVTIKNVGYVFSFETQCILAILPSAQPVFLCPAKIYGTYVRQIFMDC